MVSFVEKFGVCRTFIIIILYLGHWRHPGQCPERLFHNSQEGARWSSAHVVHVLQPAQVAQLQQKEHPA